MCRITLLSNLLLIFHYLLSADDCPYIRKSLLHKTDESPPAVISGSRLVGTYSDCVAPLRLCLALAASEQSPLLTYLDGRGTDRSYRGASYGQFLEYALQCGKREKVPVLIYHKTLAKE
eukprot:scaffold3529_cov101-Skeletonema_dohrnii-CCMP3373.AAC.2